MADEIQILNVGLLKEIISMSDEDLWLFVLKNMEKVEELRWTHKGSTYLYICLYNSFPNFRKRFFGELEHEYSYNELLYSFILDFCLEGERLTLDYYGIGGFYDHGDSCDVINSIEIMPPIEEDSDFYHQISFYVLEPAHIKHIIDAMKKNVDNLTDNTPEDLKTIKAMHKKCLKDDAYKVAYIYYEN